MKKDILILLSHIYWAYVNFYFLHGIFMLASNITINTILRMVSYLTNINHCLICILYVVFLSFDIFFLVKKPKS